MKRSLFLIGLAAMLGLAGCAGNKDESKEMNSEDNQKQEQKEEDHAHMKHSSSGEVPEGLQEAKSPTYKVGSKATLITDHMPGMKGAEATIVGAYDTTAYVVSYTPTNGGEKVTNHKWVIQEEIKDAGEKEIPAGTKVVLEANHMEGMEDAEATIDSAEKTTVYMVDYMSTTDGEEVKNHKWVTESELTKE
ncbi:YdhK family protein [Priestia flexa]|uniref:YdhK family protein n=1 Tax=Priestia flexa TaxID=86664 RepID=UPI0032ECD043